MNTVRSASEAIVTTANATGLILDDTDSHDHQCIRLAAHFARLVIDAEGNAATPPGDADILAGGVMCFASASYIAHVFAAPFETVAGLAPAQLFKATHSPAEMADKTEQIIELYNELLEASTIPADLATRLSIYLESQSDQDLALIVRAYSVFRTSLVDALEQELKKQQD